MKLLNRALKLGGFIHLNPLMEKSSETSKLRIVCQHPGLYKVVRVVEGKWDENRGNVLDTKRMSLYDEVVLGPILNQTDSKSYKI